MLGIPSEELAASVSQIITGRLLTDLQLRNLTSTVVGRIFSDWLAAPKAERELRARVEKARSHISEATAVLGALKTELDERASQLGTVLAEVEAKRKKADEYTALAKADEPTVQAIRSQLERTIREELENQSKGGRHLRQAVAAVSWVISLLLGAAVGAHWNSIEAWGMAVWSRLTSG